MIRLPISLLCVLACLSAMMTASAEETIQNAAKTNRGRLYAHGFLYENDEPKGMTIASIDPETGAWRRLPVNSSTFDVSPDGQTIAFERDNAIWNCDTGEQPNPGKIFDEDGLPMFSADGQSLLVSELKPSSQGEHKLDTTVWKMGIGGLNAFRWAEMAGARVCDCSPDGKWLVADSGSQDAIEIVRTDGTERRQLAQVGRIPHFADGKKVAYVRQWEGAIRIVDVDGTNDKLLFQAPHLTFVLTARFSPDGKQVATVLFDLRIGEEGKPNLTADTKESQPRIGIVNVATGELRVVPLPKQEGWEFAPVNRLVWR